MTYSPEEKVQLFAIFSRVGLVVLQFLTNTLIPDHDAGVFQKPINPNIPKSNIDIIIEKLFGGLTRWDGQYFLHIAQYGYTYENTLAFFPLFPLAIREISYFFIYIANLVHLSSFFSLHSVLILVSVIFNNYLFVKSSVLLYNLSFIILRDEKKAYISALLFCINPASIFFSACYSESLYCYLIFYGLLKIEVKHSVLNYVIIGLSGAARSNGLINIGFLIYKNIQLQFLGKVPVLFNFKFYLGLILSLLPFLFYQLFCFATFCGPHNVALPEIVLAYGEENNFVLPGKNSTWCWHSIPFAYSYVQKHYWNVGFLNYYELKQIPNFLLAAPIIYIMMRGTWSYVKHYKHLICYLGLVDGDSGNELPLSTYPYVVHAFALTVFSIFMIHIQVTTRLLLSSSPVPYWYCSHVISQSLGNSIESDVFKKLIKQDTSFYEYVNNRKSKWKTLLITENFKGYCFFIKWYFLSYFIVGTLMFSNYLPWT